MKVRMNIRFSCRIAFVAAGAIFTTALDCYPTEVANDVGSAAPAWAYPVSAPAAPPSKPMLEQEVHVPNSKLALTRAQTMDRFAPPDWHPDEHPPMPDVVGRGSSPKVYACAYCHLPNGAGRSENSSLAGLPAAYIAQQVLDMKKGVRKSSSPKMVEAMTYEANVTSEADVNSAADYFSKLVPRSGWIRVVETGIVPKTQVIPVNVLVPRKGVGTEPIGDRIIEVPLNPDLTNLRDSKSGYIAYVPRGSLSRGGELVNHGGAGKTVVCASCHGDGLRGAGNIPPLAGRSPSYIFRQLYDIKAGTRMGEATALMKAPVKNLTENDMVSIAAYVASLGQSTSKSRQ